MQTKRKNFAEYTKISNDNIKRKQTSSCENQLPFTKFNERNVFSTNKNSKKSPKRNFFLTNNNIPKPIFMAPEAYTCDQFAFELNQCYCQYKSSKVITSSITFNCIEFK